MFSSNTSAANGAANYIEDVFSTYLYTGNGSTQTITNGIDLAGKGGLVWTKQRNGGAVAQDNGHALIDTVRGRGSIIQSNTTAAALAPPAGYQISSFGSSGYSLGSDYYVLMNDNGSTFASWTFRKQPKFFDVVTYTGTGSARTVAHNLGSVPACIIIKRTTGTATSWAVYHRSLGNTNFIKLNQTTAVSTSATYWNNTDPTSTEFTVATNNEVNTNGETYIAYLFAHDAGGFGLTGTDNVISCGSYTGTGAAQDVTLGYEPQFLIIKNASAATNWVMLDNMRGLPVGTGDAYLKPNLSDQEVSTSDFVDPTATGFRTILSTMNTSGNFYIYIAIRRGPMKVPTSGTSVFSPTTYTGNGATGQTITSVGFPLDFVFDFKRAALDNKPTLSRLTANNALYTNLSDAQNPLSTTAFTFDVMNGFKLGNSADTNGNGDTFIAECFRRAPSFFDEVCYTGTGSARTVTHNLGVAPELMIVKTRGTVNNWIVYCSLLNTPAQNRLVLNGNFAQLTTPNATWWNSTNPTSSVFSLSGDEGVNQTGQTQVAYLFATCAGVSKCFNYTGNGSSQTINCGFTGGARWILIKRTDSTGDWFCWDSARGLVSGNDPHLSLNTTAAEVTTDDSIDTDSTGFVVNQVSATNINVSSATYIGIAIA